jgi:hypothetical protein
MSDPNKQEESFFIGWEQHMQPALRAKVRRYAFLLAGLSILAGAGMAALQQTYGISRYDWAETHAIEGVFIADPYPHLMVHVPNSEKCQTFMLVNQLKDAWPSEIARQYDGEFVKLEVGTIFRGDVAMLEGNPNQDVEIKATPAYFPVDYHSDDLGRQTLDGEIIDAKCYYGAMNPGNLKTHRACAIVCIKGGIPPVLLVRRKDDAPLYFFLADVEGYPVNDMVLDYVAEPVRITGMVESQCGLLTLKFDPQTIQRL